MNNKSFEDIKNITYNENLSESEKIQKINDILFNLIKEITKEWNKKINEIQIKYQKQLDLYKKKLLIIENKWNKKEKDLKNQKDNLKILQNQKEFKFYFFEIEKNFNLLKQSIENCKKISDNKSEISKLKDSLREKTWSLELIIEKFNKKVLDITSLFGNSKIDNHIDTGLSVLSLNPIPKVASVFAVTQFILTIAKIIKHNTFDVLKTKKEISNFVDYVKKVWEKKYKTELLTKIIEDNKKLKTNTEYFKQNILKGLYKISKNIIFLNKTKIKKRIINQKFKNMFFDNSIIKIKEIIKFLNLTKEEIFKLNKIFLLTKTVTHSEILKFTKIFLKDHDLNIVNYMFLTSSNSNIDIDEKIRICDEAIEFLKNQLKFENSFKKQIEKEINAFILNKAILKLLIKEIELNKESEKYKKQYSKQQEKLKKINKELLTKQKKLEKFEKQISYLEKLNLEKQDLENSINDLKPQLEEKTQKIFILNYEFNNLKERKDVLYEKIIKKQIQKENLLNEISKKENFDCELVRNIISQNNQIKENNNIIKENLIKISNLINQKSQIKKEISNLESEIKKKNILILQKDFQISNLQNEITSKTETIKEISYNIKELEEQNLKKQEQILTLNNNIKEVEEVLSKKKIYFNNIKQYLEANKVKKQKISDQLITKQNEIDKNEKLISNLKTQIQEKENKLKEVNYLLETKNEELEILRIKKEILDFEISDLNAQISQKESEISNLDSKILQTKNQISKLNEKIKQLKTKLVEKEKWIQILSRYKRQVIKSWNLPTQIFWEKIKSKSENEIFNYNKVFIDKYGNFNEYSSISSINSLTHNEIEWFGWFLREYVLFDEGRFNKFLSLKQTLKYVDNLFENKITYFLTSFKDAKNYKQVQDLFWELFVFYGVRVKNIAYNHRGTLFYLWKKNKQHMGPIIEEQNKIRITKEKLNTRSLLKKID